MAASEKGTTSYLEAKHKRKLDNIIESNEPTTEEELLVLVVHAVLLQNGFKVVCIGKSKSKTEDGLSGLDLPEGWNEQEDPDCFEFTYRETDSDDLYTLRALTIEESLCFNLLKQGKGRAKATEVQLEIVDHVARKRRPITINWLQDSGFLWKLIERGLLGKHEDLLERRDYELRMEVMERERPRQAGRTHQAALHDGVPMRPPNLLQESNFQGPSPFAYGDADRFPGHPGMGGMIMDPLRSGGMGLRPPNHPGLPRGSVPPGARFDPFGPLTEFDYSSGSRGPRRSFDPNPDHLRRPGFDDDMFM